jgi:hypothetical protein
MKSTSKDTTKEADYQRTVVEAAKFAGWLVHAELPAQTASGRYLTRIQGDAGFPDLVLVHPTRKMVLCVELKRRPNKATDKQMVWLQALSAAGVSAALVFVPGGLPRLLDVITGASSSWTATDADIVTFNDPTMSDQLT